MHSYFPQSQGFQWESKNLNEANLTVKNLKSMILDE